ncbi:MAG: hypothetical protein QXI58_03480 [Candidatus Micrarchaeia archaeon]
MFISLKKLAEDNFINVPKKPGVYIIKWIKNGKLETIPRFLKNDTYGVLYIGFAKGKGGLYERLKNLWESIGIAYELFKGKYTHTFAISLIYSGLISIIKLEEIFLWYKEMTASNAEDQEKAALLEYTRCYGEPPPLNLQIGREYFLIIGIGKLGKSKFVVKLDTEIKNVLFS